MCLGIPAKIIYIDGVKAGVDVSGAKKEANLTLLKGAAVGDYVIVHAGFAIEKVDEARAKETLRLIDMAAGTDPDPGSPIR